jgi:hypothetical protein
MYYYIPVVTYLILHVLDPCREDVNVFLGRPEAEDMGEAISKFLDGMEGQERSGFKDLHRFPGRLPCPDVEKVARSMSHSQALEVGFIPKMDEEEQKRFTPSELILYRHALEHRYLFVLRTCSRQTIYVYKCSGMYTVHTQYIQSLLSG